jgi:hypothetical protein
MDPTQTPLKTYKRRSAYASRQLDSSSSEDEDPQPQQLQQQQQRLQQPQQLQQQPQQQQQQPQQRQPEQQQEQEQQPDEEEEDHSADCSSDSLDLHLSDDSSSGCSDDARMHENRLLVTALMGNWSAKRYKKALFALPDSQRN